MVAFLVALGLFVAFCAALLNPYGRKLLGTMAAVAGVIAAIVLIVIGMNDAETKRQERAQAAAQATQRPGMTDQELFAATDAATPAGR